MLASSGSDTTTKIKKIQSLANKYPFWRRKSQPSTQGSRGQGGWGNPSPRCCQQYGDPTSVRNAIFSIFNLNMSWWYINVLLDYNPCVCPKFLFLVRIKKNYTKSWSLYVEVSVLLSKWPDFYAKVLDWILTHEHRSVGPLSLKARCMKLRQVNQRQNNTCYTPSIYTYLSLKI